MCSTPANSGYIEHITPPQFARTHIHVPDYLRRCLERKADKAEGRRRREYAKEGEIRQGKEKTLGRRERDEGESEGSRKEEGRRKGLGKEERARTWGRTGKKGGKEGNAGVWRKMLIFVEHCLLGEETGG